MKKIVITGGLGYIGTELCKIYSGESRYNDITVIDSRFVSGGVKQLTDWGINFVQGSILDESLLEKHLKDADIVIHLAGITDVAYVATEGNLAKDNEIKEIGIDGTKNVLKYIGDGCKLIFPSTHVVYEGLKETKFDVEESEPTCPILTYATGKAQSEKDIIESGKNYVILRLASVYGYGGDTMRINIMPNLFSKVASQDGTIKLFSGGIQLKSLVPVIDVARCMKFMEEKSIQNEIFHLSKETMTVKEVAQLCKTINPKLTLIETKDEIPNKGYTISNKKLLSTGFEFRYNIDDCIKEMISSWSKKDLRADLEYIIKGGKEFVDNRGKISNYELTEPINLIGYIESKLGTVRANHYHPIQEQKCLLVKGQYISVIKDLSVPNSPLETKIINEGDIAVIKPNAAHAMVFTKDSIFLNLVRGEREHANYGITHTIAHTLVNDHIKDLLLITAKKECRSCGGKNLQRVLSLGMSPLANNLLNSNDDPYETFPLELNHCETCHNCQLSCTVPPGKMFDDYLYVSSTTASFRKHFEEAANQYTKEFFLDKNTLVVDIGSNDGIALKPLKEKGIRVLGIEPAKNIASLANENGIQTINSYFNHTIINQIISENGKATLVTASNVFAHSDHLAYITQNAFDILHENGSFIIEVQYLVDTICDLTFDNIYHEHVNYWSVTALNTFFNKLGFCLYKVQHIDTHGGSIRAYIKRNAGNIDISVQDFLDREELTGIKENKLYEVFGSKVKEIKRNVNENLYKLKLKHPIIAGYGAPAKATTALNYFGINSKQIDYIIEDNPLKHNKYIPGTGIEVKSKHYVHSKNPSIIIVMAWNFFEEIKKNNKELTDRGIKFISIKQLQDPGFDIEKC